MQGLGDGRTSERQQGSEAGVSGLMTTIYSNTLWKGRALVSNHPQFNKLISGNGTTASRDHGVCWVCGRLGMKAGWTDGCTYTHTYIHLRAQRSACAPALLSASMHAFCGVRPYFTDQPMGAYLSNAGLDLAKVRPLYTS